MTLFDINLGSWVGTTTQLLLALVTADVISGAARAIRTKTFDWRVLADFYATNIVPYLLGYLALVLIVKAALPDVNLFGLPFNDAVLTAAWGTIVLAIGKSVIANLKEVFNPADIFDEDEDVEF